MSILTYFFLLPTHPGLKGHSYKAEAVAGGEVCEGRQILTPGVRSYGPTVYIFKKRLDQVWKDVFPHLLVQYRF